MKRRDFILNKNHILKSKAFIEEINKYAKESINEFVFNSEKTYDDQVNELVKEFSEDKYNKIMLIAGPSSSGKTTSSNLIKDKLEALGINSVSISLDDFFVNRTDTPLLPDGSYDFESIYALDLNYFSEFIDEILKKGTAKMPLFDFLTGKRKKDYVDVYLDEHSVLIIEGLHALNPMLIKNHDAEIYKVYVCLNTDIYFQNKLVLPAKTLRLMRRILRDYYSRGHSVSTSISLWPNVLKGEDMYIKPFKEDADYIIDTTHLYEPLLYAKYLSPILETVENNKTTKTLQSILENCEKADKNLVPANSLLWEFLVNKN